MIIARSRCIKNLTIRSKIKSTHTKAIIDTGYESMVRSY